MRIRATVAAVTGAMALSAFVAPSALAADSGSSYKADVAKVLEAAHHAAGKSAFSSSAAAEPQPYQLDVTFSNFKIAKAVKIGTTNHVSTTVTYTLNHGADVDVTADDFLSGPYIYRGSFTDQDNWLIGDEPATCKVVSATAETCTGKIDAYPGDGELASSDAGTWKGAAIAIAYNGQLDTDNGDITKVGLAEQGSLGTTLVQRVSRLTVNAAPEPVKKGATITVTGALTRANWDDNKYHGYTGQSVQLEFRKKNSKKYTLVKTVKTDSRGNLKTTVKASVDGYFRYNFAGTTTTPAIAAAGDFVDVK
ncbi:hypothetical protein OIB37_17125 [Streptomyces sp. NBC_00820]|uniref:hypothetical protein n=1 Tax=Streptomyces sp. NBC_00820 TaxID=2975842 RepID=UPI002ED24E21|nr:hypothetical protein OIB37_17125 [Streptomyces sp. NBC_00820]